MRWPLIKILLGLSLYFFSGGKVKAIEADPSSLSYTVSYEQALASDHFLSRSAISLKNDHTLQNFILEELEEEEEDFDEEKANNLLFVDLFYHSDILAYVSQAWLIQITTSNGKQIPKDYSTPDLNLLYQVFII